LRDIGETRPSNESLTPIQLSGPRSEFQSCFSKAVRMSTLTPQRVLAVAALFALLSPVVIAQTSTQSSAAPVATPGTAPAPSFDVADVHVSPHSNNANMRGGNLNGGRYLVRQATMTTLIALAYGVDTDHILGGPPWLDTTHFDITASAPRLTSPDDVKLMLRSLLADRFKLIVHPGTKDLPAFVLTVDKGGPKLKPGDESVPAGCQGTPNPPPTPEGGVPLNYVTCHSLTLDQIADDLHGMAGGYLTNPVVNSTGIKGIWDFDIKWTGRGQLARAGGDGISIFDAVQHQLGLKLEAKTAPLPVIMVDSVNEAPTPNPPGLDKMLPPPPPAAFDVTVIKPGDPNAKNAQGQITGNLVDVKSITLHDLITIAWELSSIDKEAIVGAPKWVDQDRFDILGKTAPDPNAPKGVQQIDMDGLEQMIRTMLADRFQMKSHMGEHLADAYTMVADNPKMKKGDPTMRTSCHEGPGPDGKDPRLTNPILGRLLTCQNMTMAEFGEELRTLANGYMYYPVLDKTGLEGGYDFTLSFSSIGQLQPGIGGGAPPPPSGSGSPGTPSEPSGAVSLLDAIDKQMGIKLVKERRMEPALIIDSISETPTPN
jgi:uncharacterized protein (TIGR03435 family)